MCYFEFELLVCFFVLGLCRDGLLVLCFYYGCFEFVFALAGLGVCLVNIAVCCGFFAILLILAFARVLVGFCRLLCLAELGIYNMMHFL